MKRFLIMLLLCGLLSPLVAQTGVRPGIIQVKLTQQTAQQLQQMAQPLSATAGTLNVGIQSLDVVNARYHAVKMRPLFIIGGRFEQRQRAFGLDLWYEIELEDKENTARAVKAYAELDGIDVAEPAYTIRLIGNVAAEQQENMLPQATTNDPAFSNQWHYHNTGQVGVAGVDIRLPGAWDKTMGSTNVIVSVVDGGIDYMHEDLAANVWSGVGHNFVSGGGVTPEDHGTHVAGTIAAVSNNGIGVAGIAGGNGSGNGVRLMSCQIFEGDDGGPGGSAIAWGADHGAVISQNSWGYEKEGVYNQADKDGINYFIQYAGKDEYGQPLPGTPMVGGIVNFAAGNDNSNKDNRYPGAWSEVLSVAAVGPTGKRAYYSNYGATVDISAPGGDAEISGRTIYSTIPNNRYAYMQGTSMACPHVSGVAALMLSRFGSSTYTPDRLRERLLLSVNPLIYDQATAPLMGAGLIDASIAVADDIPVTGINVLPKAVDVFVSRTTSLTAEVLPANAWNKRYQWMSRNTDIATVTPKDGVVSGISEGQVYIVAITDEGLFKDSCLITVNNINVTGITISPSTFTLINKRQQQFYYTIIPSDATDKTVQWESRNPSVVSIDRESGLATAMDIGKTFVIVISNDGGLKDSCELTIAKQVTDVSIPQKRVRILRNNIVHLQAVVVPDDAYDKTITWSSDKASIASVNDDGVVKGNTLGTTTIRVHTQDGNLEASCIIEVVENIHVPQGFSPNGDGVNDYFELTLDSKETYTLK
ncbi:MAG: S8 family serine peptidase, partial [Prevotellaceae bacterium]|nr:S8 family serine peptidase [Prevotellaceae bacterium]